MLKTNKYVGTRQIYDYMRKRVGKVDERKPNGKAANEKRKITPAKNKQSPPPKTAVTASPDAVKVTADGHLNGGDEKVVAYRQRPRSHASIECETPPDSDMSEESE